MSWMLVLLFKWAFALAFVFLIYAIREGLRWLIPECRWKELLFRERFSPGCDYRTRRRETR